MAPNLQSFSVSGLTKSDPTHKGAGVIPEVSDASESSVNQPVGAGVAASSSSGVSAVVEQKTPPASDVSEGGHIVMQEEVEMQAMQDVEEGYGEHDPEDQPLGMDELAEVEDGEHSSAGAHGEPDEDAEEDSSSSFAKRAKHG
ncbi:uncharacterized protein LOC119355746 [Triticum dicoccoides]|uniref:uncharacterized protein LOC119355746 n=1 Tax=Triticum dicoccoides TaxID=85692 RepID=UPI00188E469A|nr:uncharacterized protein LOC119355746 [Triticum dicoccoides]